MKRNIFLVILSFVVVGSFAQNTKKSSSRQIVVTSFDSVVYANVLIKNPKKVRCDLNKSYHWYFANEIKVNKGDFSGKLLHGRYEVRDVDGKMFKLGHFEEGLKEGEWKLWNAQGNLIKYELWSYGKLKTSKVYNSRGKLVKESVFEKEEKKKQDITDKKKEKEQKAAERAKEKEEKAKEREKKKLEKEQAKQQENKESGEKKKKEGKKEKSGKGKKERNNKAEEKGSKEKKEGGIFNKTSELFGKLKAKVKKEGQ